MNLSKKGILIISILSLFVVGQPGCTSIKGKANLSNASIESDTTTRDLNVAVVPVNNIPHIRCIAYDKGRGRAAAKGANELGKEGAIGGLKLPLYALLQCNDPLAGAMIFVTLPVLVPACGLGGAVLGSSAGAIGGAIKGDYKEGPMEDIGDMVNFADTVSAMDNLNKALSEHLAKTGMELTHNNYTIKNIEDVTHDFDIILKVGITRLVYKGEIERDPDISFETVVHVEVTDSAENTYLSNRYSFSSKEISLSKWNKKKGQPLQIELNRCYQDISENIIKEIFILNERSLVEFLSE